MFKNFSQQYYSFVILFVFLTFLFIFVKSEPKTEALKFARVGGVSIKLELAINKNDQIRGLSGRESLDQDSGMLFVFQKPGKYYFWMKDMNFPIDMIWINENNEIVYIKKEASPDDYLATYGPEEDSKYVLEINSGLSDKYNIKTGDKVEFTF